MNKRKKTLVTLMLLFFVHITIIQAQFTIWESGTRNIMQNEPQTEYISDLRFEIFDTTILHGLLKNSCLLLSLSAKTAEGIAQDICQCIGITDEGSVGQVGGYLSQTLKDIPYRNLNIADVGGSSVLLKTIRQQIRPVQGKGSYFVTMGENFKIEDTISIQKDSLFWAKRYPNACDTLTYDTHIFPIGKDTSNNKDYLFAVINHCEMVIKPKVGEIRLEKQAIVAYSLLENSYNISDIIEIDDNWNLNSDLIIPKNDPHHVNDAEYSQGALTYSCRGTSTIHKIEFKDGKFGPIKWIIGEPEEVLNVNELPFIGNNFMQPLMRMHGASTFLNSKGEEIVVTYNNGCVESWHGHIQPLGYFVIKIDGDNAIKDIGSYIVTSKVNPNDSLYSYCCGGTKEVFPNNELGMHAIAFEKGITGSINSKGTFVANTNVNIEPLISVKIPPDSVGGSWVDVLDIYPPENFLAEQAGHSITTFEYSNLPEAVNLPVIVWYQNGTTYAQLSDYGTVFWEYKKNKVVLADTIILPGIIGVATLEEELIPFVEDNTFFMWQTKGGYKVLTSANDHNNSVIYPNPPSDSLTIESE